VTLEGRLRVAQPLALAAGPALLAVALAVPYRWLFFAAYAYLLVTAGAYWWARVLGQGVRLTRELNGTWAQVGDELEQVWELVNQSRAPLLWLEIDDGSTLPGDLGRRVAAVGPGERATWTTRSACTRRGVYTLGPLRLRLADPLGLFVCAWQHGEGQRIIVYPPLARLPELTFPKGQRGGMARADLLRQYITPSVGGLRDYVPGDQPSHIHWRTAARRGKLMVKEFDQEIAGALWIALDLCSEAYEAVSQTARGSMRGRQAGRPNLGYGQSSVVAEVEGAGEWDSALEVAVVLAGSFAAQALGEGRSVALLADDGRRRVVSPGRGPRQLWRILGELVDTQATGKVALGELLRQGRLAHRAELAGAGLAVVTPDVSGQWVAALAEWQRERQGAALALLVVPPGTTAGGLEVRLAGLGATTHSFVLGRPLPLLNPPKPKAVRRVTPLGRIV
jgi:uncharacterized protein (DUF58 family)